VPEHVQVDLAYPGECGSPLNHLRDATGGHRLTTATQPQLRESCKLVPSTQPQIALKGGSGLSTKLTIASSLRSASSLPWHAAISARKSSS
jgi:hypothetical protein